MKTKPNPNYVNAKPEGVHVDFITGKDSHVVFTKPTHQSRDRPRYDFRGGKWVRLDTRK